MALTDPITGEQLLKPLPGNKSNSKNHLEIQLFMMTHSKIDWRYLLAKLIGTPFREGFINDGRREIHMFTDYRWNDSSVSRRWHIDPEHYDADRINVRSLELKVPVSDSNGQ